MAAPTATDTRRALLARLIDHAALFPPASMSVADALEEDARLRASEHAWIVGRYPGTAGWLLRLDEETPPAPEPAFIAFCRECAREPFRDWQPSGREPAVVADALAETRDARRRYAHTLPPTDLTLPPELDVMDRYRSEVWPAVGSRGTLDVPSFRAVSSRNVQKPS